MPKNILSCFRKYVKNLKQQTDFESTSQNLLITQYYLALTTYVLTYFSGIFDSLVKSRGVADCNN